jgi:hypothetical protein
MSMIDIAGGATLTKLYRHTGIWPLTIGLLGFLAYRAYQKRSRVADMLGGAMAGVGKLPAMALPLMRPALMKKSRPVRKKRARRRSAPRRMRAPSRANSSHAIH